MLVNITGQGKTVGYAPYFLAGRTDGRFVKRHSGTSVEAIINLDMCTYSIVVERVSNKSKPPCQVV